MTFQLGKVSDRIIEGELEKKDAVAVKISEDITSLINALIPKTRAAVQTRSGWMEE